MTRRVRAWAPYLAVAAIGGVAVLYRLLSQFNPVDDEGYVLIALNQFFSGGHLYDQVYGQYGPVYYELYRALFGLPGIALNHESGRIFVAILYVVIATGCGVVAGRHTRNLLAGIGAQIVAFAVLFQIVREPTHPIGLTTALVVAIVGMALLANGRARGTAIALGALVAALTLVKINMGVPAGAGLVAAAAIAFGPQRHRRAILAGAGLGLGLVVVAVTSSKLDVGWVRSFALLELAGVAAILVRAAGGRAGADAIADWLKWFFTGAFALGLLSCVIIIALGTSPHGLVDGVLIAPGKHPADQSSDLMLRARALALAAVVIAAAGAAARGLGERLPIEVRAGGRLLAAAAIWLFVSSDAPGGVDPGTMRLVAGVVLSWLMVAPPGELRDGNEISFARLAVALVATLEVLQAYPIGFSRVEAAGVPFAVVGAVIAADGAALLSDARGTFAVGASGAREWKPRSQLRRTAYDLARFGVPALAAAIVLIGGVIKPGADARDAYRAGRSVDLPGMHMLHLPDQTATAYEQLAAAARGCHQIVVVPSFYSIYPWADKRPPTGQNANAWPLLLDAKAQAQVARAIAHTDDLCMLYNAQAEQVLIGQSEAREPADRAFYRLLSTTRFAAVTSISVGELGGSFTLLRRSPTGTVGGGLPPLH